MHRHISLPLLVLLMCASLAAAPATMPAGVSVKRTPPKVTTRTFDPSRPPAEMPPLNGNEAAVTESEFACGMQVGVQVTQQGDAKPVMTITDVKAELRLEIVIWLPTNVTAKIRVHEQGHREIAEILYKDAEA